MLKSNKTLLGIMIMLIIIGGFSVIAKGGKGEGYDLAREIKPVIADIQVTISTTGVIEPQNRLEIKPSIDGRIEKVLVREGDRVKEGQILAWMSSTERAALLDAALAEGEEAVKYWADVYKATPLISPIAGEVIVRAAEPGQTVTSQTPVIVLSDRLIVSGQFDETDIGRVKKGQDAFITLDAYPDVKIKGVVDHIAYESELANNVTIYDVDIAPKEVPDFFRSGMSANVEVIQMARKNALLIPLNAVYADGKKAFVLVKDPRTKKIAERSIETGLSDERDVEIISGLTAEDIVIAKGKAGIPQKKKKGQNPFMPSHRR